MLEATSPALGGLVRCHERGCGPESAQHRLIVGDNLPVLKLLEPELGGRVDLIYIDPPYNTGSPLTYEDDFRRTAGNGSSQRRGEAHSQWLSMMLPRLMVARRLLSERGLIAVSIDDNEVHRLRLLLDEVFGESGFVAQITVSLNPKGRQLARHFATSHEYLLLYAKNPELVALQASSKAAVDPRDFPQEHDGRRFRLLPLRNTNKKFDPSTRPNLYYPLFVDTSSGEVSLHDPGGWQRVDPVFGDGRPAVWRWGQAKVREEGEALVGRVVKGRLGKRWDVSQRDWLTADRRKKLKTVWLASDVGSTDDAVRELKLRVGAVFSGPKPVRLLLRLLDMMPCDALVLDFFAGSGTTGDAVYQANLADGGGRRFVLVQSAEPVSGGRFATIDQITEARLVAASSALASETSDATDLGLRCELHAS